MAKGHLAFLGKSYRRRGISSSPFGEKCTVGYETFRKDICHFFCFDNIFFGHAHAQNKIDKVKFAQGEVCGRLLKSALIIDAYYEFCFPSETRVGSYTGGVIKLAKEKFGIDLLAMLNDSDKTLGRNITKDAFTEVEKDLALIGGCDSTLIQEWKVLAHQQYNDNFQVFHKHKPR